MVCKYRKHRNQPILNNQCYAMGEGIFSFYLHTIVIKGQTSASPVNGSQSCILQLVPKGKYLVHAGHNRISG